MFQKARFSLSIVENTTFSINYLKTFISVKKLVGRIMNDNGLKMVSLTCHAAPDGYQQADLSCAIVSMFLGILKILNGSPDVQISTSMDPHLKKFKKS